MRRTPAALLALLLALAPTAVAAPWAPSAAGVDSGAASGSAATATPIVSPNGTASYLSIPGNQVQRAGFGTGGIDVAGALAIRTDGLHSRFSALAVEEQLEAAETPTARRAVVRDAARTVETRIDRLEARQRAGIRGYVNGTLSARAFLREMARIDARAGQIRSAIRHIEAHTPAATIDGEDVSTWARNRRLQLAPLEGPVRDRLARTIRGNAGPVQVYAETSSDGVVLAMIAGDRYVREAFLGAARAGTEGFESFAAAERRVRTELYPWAWSHSSGPDAAGSEDVGIYRFTLFHEHGELTAYLDKGSGEVFREAQAKYLANVPVTGAAARVNGTLQLRVNHTHQGGPIEVTVVRNATGAPVDAAVAVDGVPVGRTGADGRLWTIAPRTARITVTATGGGESVSVVFPGSPLSPRQSVESGED